MHRRSDWDRQGSRARLGARGAPVPASSQRPQSMEDLSSRNMSSGCRKHVLRMGRNMSLGVGDMSLGAGQQEQFRANISAKNCG